MSSKVFEEAIADAKKLREVAEENAKKAIIEAVTPKIREFIENELLEDDSTLTTETAEDSLEGDEVVLDESGLKKLASLLGADVVASIQESTSEGDFLSSVGTAVSSLTDKQKAELLNIADKVNEEKRTLQAAEIDTNNELQENSNMSNKSYEVDLDALKEAVEAELNGMQVDAKEINKSSLEDKSVDELEEMLQELKLVLDLGDEIEADQVPEDLRGMVEDDDDEDEEVELSDAEDEDEDADADADDADEEEPDQMVDFDALSEIDLDEVIEIDEKMLAEELVRLRLAVNEGKTDHHFGGKGSGKVGVKKSFGGGAEGVDVFTNPPNINKLAETIRRERRKNLVLNEKLNKYRSAVKTLREQLEDLNLFNAKLLYVNKLLQNKGLNESEKKSVIKALDEANSLSEAKSLYKSLTETFARGTKNSLIESKARGSSSKPTTSSSPKKGSGIPELDRWQRLAGLK